MSNSLLGMRAPPLYCHNCASAYELRVVVVRAPRHMIHIEPAVPMRRKCLDLLVVGLRAAPYGRDFPADCTRRQKRACKAYIL